MPTYCYRLPNDIIIEREFPIGEAPDEIAHGEIIAKRDSVAAMRSFSGAVRFSSKPGRIYKSRRIISEAMGVQPDQVAEAQAAANQHGIRCHYHPDGAVEFDSWDQREAMRKNLGYIDRS